MSAANRLYEMMLAYRMMAMLSKPFKEWEAYQMGLIDEKGKKIRNATNTLEKDQFSKFNNIVRNIKRIINKVNLNTENKLAQILVGASLLREHLEEENVDDALGMTHRILSVVEATYFENEIGEVYYPPSNLTLKPGRYELHSEFYEEVPLIYIKEDTKPNEIEGWGIYHLTDIKGDHYMASIQDLKRI